MTYIGNRDVIMWSYNPYEPNACALAQVLGISMLYNSDTRYRLKAASLIINWGNTQWPEMYNGDGFGYGSLATRHDIKTAFINPPDSVQLSCDKIKMLQCFTSHNVRTPRWTLDSAIAQSWGTDIVCRTTLNGTLGSGIVITPSDKPVPAPLYVEYLPVHSEYRVHVFGDRIIAMYQKVYTGHSGPEPIIKNSRNGFVPDWDFAIPYTLLCDIQSQAIAGTAALGLTFSGCDVVVSDNKAYMIETNTAPTLAAQSVRAYAAAIRRFCGPTVRVGDRTAEQVDG